MICDDAVAYPRLVEFWLGNGDGFRAVGVVTSADELLERVGDLSPDVLLLDLMLPHGPASPELVTSVRELAPGVRIVLVSNLPADALEAVGKKLGVDGCCSKASTADALLAALRAV